MEKPTSKLDTKKEENFTLFLDNKPNNPHYALEISLFSGQINFQAVNNIGNNIVNYESSYSFEDLAKLDDYFKYCKDINNLYNFILQLKKNNEISLTQENGNIFLIIHVIQPIENIIKIPLNKSPLNNKSIILSLNESNNKLKEKIKFLEEQLDNNNKILKSRIIKMQIKGYSHNLLFIEKEIEKQLKKNVITYDLIYKASKDGDKSENFHSKCDNIENTLIIIKSTNDKIFGAFTTQLWNPIGYVKDPLAFVFSINNKKIYNILDNINGEMAIYTNSLYGPCFGEGTDFGLYSQCTTRNDNWCSNKKTYNFNGEHLIGNVRFQVSDYEVYHVIVD